MTNIIKHALIGFAAGVALIVALNSFNQVFVVKIIPTAIHSITMED